LVEDELASVVLALHVILQCRARVRSDSYTYIHCLLYTCRFGLPL